jgi:hypothetical protein
LVEIAEAFAHDAGSWGSLLSWRQQSEGVSARDEREESNIWRLLRERVSLDSTT